MKLCMRKNNSLMINFSFSCLILWLVCDHAKFSDVLVLLGLNETVSSVLEREYLCYLMGVFVFPAGILGEGLNLSNILTA